MPEYNDRNIESNTSGYSKEVVDAVIENHGSDSHSNLNIKI